MPISDDFLSMLRCPDDHSCLTRADAALVTQLNAAASTGRLKNKAGQAVSRQIDGALVREDRTLAYPIIDDIPILLIDEAIPLPVP
jgi:uncharacterized protein YbaR (Trm112 family)